MDVLAPLIFGVVVWYLIGKFTHYAYNDIVPIIAGFVVFLFAYFVAFSNKSDDDKNNRDEQETDEWEEEERKIIITQRKKKKQDEYEDE